MDRDRFAGPAPAATIDTSYAGGYLAFVLRWPACARLDHEPFDRGRYQCRSDVRAQLVDDVHRAADKLRGERGQDAATAFLAAAYSALAGAVSPETFARVGQELFAGIDPDMAVQTLHA